MFAELFVGNRIKVGKKVGWRGHDIDFSQRSSQHASLKGTCSGHKFLVQPCGSVTSEGLQFIIDA